LVEGVTVILDVVAPVDHKIASPESLHPLAVRVCPSPLMIVAGLLSVGEVMVGVGGETIFTTTEALVKVQPLAGEVAIT
jgi:hypothetical protein